jgi:hypothetical protein
MIPSRLYPLAAPPMLPSFKLDTLALLAHAQAQQAGRG